MDRGRPTAEAQVHPTAFHSVRSRVDASAEAAPRGPSQPSPPLSSARARPGSARAGPSSGPTTRGTRSFRTTSTTARSSRRSSSRRTTTAHLAQRCVWAALSRVARSRPSFQIAASCLHPQDAGGLPVAAQDGVHSARLLINGLWRSVSRTLPADCNVPADSVFRLVRFEPGFMSALSDAMRLQPSTTVYRPRRLGAS